MEARDRNRGERRRTGRNLADRPQLAGELRREIDGLKTEVSQIPARKDRWSSSRPPALTPTESVKRLFAFAREGQGGRPQAARCWPTTWKWIRSSKSLRKNPPEELEYVVVQNCSRPSEA